MFWEQVQRHYNAGSAHEFLLHFNVQDLLYDDVYGYLPALDYLMEQLNALGCDLVVGYNTSQGIIWPEYRAVVEHTADAKTDSCRSKRGTRN